MAFQPTTKQQIFQAAVDAYEEVGYGGARGGAKTVGICWVAIDHMSIKYPGNVGLIVRRDLVDLQKTTMLEFERFLTRHHPELLPGQHIRWHRSSPIHCDMQVLPGVWSRVYFSDTKDAVSWQSGNLAWVALDEASEIGEDFVISIRGALERHTLPDGRVPPKRLFWGSNPGPGWCKEEFPVGPRAGRVTREITDRNGVTSKITRAFVPANPSDNPHLPPRWEAELRANNPAIWCKRFLDGDWDAFEGQVFSEFDRAKHVLAFRLDPVKMAATGWRQILSLDWGFVNPCSVHNYAIDFDGHWWIWDEYYQAGRTPAQVADSIRHMGSVPRQRQIIDYAAQDQLTRTSLADILNAHGYHFMPCTKRKHGADGSIMFIKQLMQKDMLHISANCTNLIRELINCAWDTTPRAVSAPEHIEDKNDHAIDDFCYACEEWRGKPSLAAKQRREQNAEITVATADLKPWKPGQIDWQTGQRVKTRESDGFL